MWFSLDSTIEVGLLPIGHGVFELAELHESVLARLLGPTLNHISATSVPLLGAYLTLRASPHELICT